METIQPKQTDKLILRKMKELEALEKEKARLEDPKTKDKPWTPPFGWQFKFSQSKKVNMAEKILVMMFNKKNQIEPPKFLPIYGNIIVYKNRVYRYNPKAIWTMLVRGKPQVFCIREIDMEPISNLDIAAVEADERHTQYHKLLLEAAIAAKIQPEKKSANIWIIVGVIILVVGGLAYFFLKG